MTADTVNLEVLRRRQAKTAEALRSIDEHLRRLQAAKQARAAALSRIQSEIALVGPSELDHDED
jgi:hypothetical protein